MDRPLWEKRNWLVSFPSPTPQHNHGTTCRKHSLPTMLAPSPALPTLWWNHHSQSRLPQSQSNGLPPPENLPKVLPTLHLLTQEFCKASVLVAAATGFIAQTDRSTPGGPDTTALAHIGSSWPWRVGDTTWQEDITLRNRKCSFPNTEKQAQRQTK